MEICKATLQDLPGILQLYRGTVSAINKKDYDQEQIKAWLSGAEDIDKWTQRIQKQHFVVANYQSEIIGFASISTTGYLDVIYVHKDHQGKRVATNLLEQLEDYARQKNVKQITSDVSITARSFFEFCGFTTIKEQRVERNGVFLTNYKMEKSIAVPRLS